MKSNDLKEFASNFLENTSIDVSSVNHETSFLYKITVPFQVTYEYCSGNGENDYINIMTLSEKEAFFSQEAVKLHNYVFKTLGGHYHDYYEFLIVLEGEVHQQIEGRDYLYPAGTCCLINRNLTHKEYYGGTAKLLFLGFTPSFINQIINSYKQAYFDIEKRIADTELFDFIDADLQHPDSKRYLDFIPASKNTHARTNLHELTENLMHEILFPQFGSTFQVQALLCKILDYLSSDYFHCTSVNLSDNSDRLLFSRIEHLLDENNGRLSRSELATMLNYSGDYINRIVNKYSGMCLHDFAMDFCLVKAAEMIRTTNISVSDIAIRLGFSNRTYFYKLFKNKYGVTPKEYRKNA